MNIVEVKEVKKIFGDKTAVDGVSFYVNEGEIFGLRFLAPGMMFLKFE